MGAWGEEIFENDNALDCLGDVIDSFSESIEEWFEHGVEDSTDYNNTYEGNIGPLIFMLNRLCETCPVHPPEPEKVKEWDEKFFIAYDINAAEGWGEESATLRRKLFKREFIKLLELSKSYHDENA